MMEDFPLVLRGQHSCDTQTRWRHHQSVEAACPLRSTCQGLGLGVPVRGDQDPSVPCTGCLGRRAHPKPEVKPVASNRTHHSQHITHFSLGQWPRLAWRKLPATVKQDCCHTHAKMHAQDCKGCPEPPSWSCYQEFQPCLCWDQSTGNFPPSWCYTQWELASD